MSKWTGADDIRSNIKCGSTLGDSSRGNSARFDVVCAVDSNGWLRGSFCCVGSDVDAAPTSEINDVVVVAKLFSSNGLVVAGWRALLRRRCSGLGVDGDDDIVDRRARVRIQSERNYEIVYLCCVCLFILCGTIWFFVCNW